MLKYKAEIDSKEIEIEVHESLSYLDSEKIIGEALEFCFDGTGINSHLPEFAFETALVLQASNIDEFDEGKSVESMWNLINSTDLVEFIVKNVKYVNYSTMKKSFFAAYNEKLRVACNPWSSAAESLAELVQTMNSNQKAVSAADVEKLVQLSEAIANKDEGKIVDGILDFHEKNDNK